jgi:hypothetical protein
MVIFVIVLVDIVIITVLMLLLHTAMDCRRHRVIVVESIVFVIDAVVRKRLVNENRGDAVAIAVDRVVSLDKDLADLFLV